MCQVIVLYKSYSFVDIDTIMPVCTAVFDKVQPLYCDVLASIIHKLNRTTCGLYPFPTKLLMSHLSSIINIILRILLLFYNYIYLGSYGRRFITIIIINRQKKTMYTQIYKQKNY